MEPKCSFLYSHEPATGPYLQQNSMLVAHYRLFNIFAATLHILK
jgi:hypothetical protein